MHPRGVFYDDILRMDADDKLGDSFVKGICGKFDGSIVDIASI